MSQSTVAQYMQRHPRPASPTWRTFLRNHASQIMAADFFVVPTVTFRLLYVFVILAHERRRTVHVAVTEYPTGPWSQSDRAAPARRQPRSFALRARFTRSSPARRDVTPRLAARWSD
jgi:hypothetical protein